MSTTLKAAKVAKELRSFVDALLLATAVAQVERERVDKIERQVLSEDVYMIDSKHAECGRAIERVTEPRHVFLIGEEDRSRYFAKLSAIHVASGFERAAEGYCPACTAEALQTKAEWALIAAAEQFFPGVTNDRLLCGTEKKNGLDTRREYLDLLIGLVVNAPGYKSPLAA